MVEILTGLGGLLIAMGAASLIASVGEHFERVGKKLSGDLKTRLLALIHDHPEGIKMTDLGSRLNIEWRRLIAPLGELLKEGKIDKKDGKYYPH